MRPRFVIVRHLPIWIKLTWPLWNLCRIVIATPEFIFSSFRKIAISFAYKIMCGGNVGMVRIGMEWMYSIYTRTAHSKRIPSFKSISLSCENIRRHIKPVIDIQIRLFLVWTRTVSRIYARESRFILSNVLNHQCLRVSRITRTLNCERVQEVSITAYVSFTNTNVFSVRLHLWVLAIHNPLSIGMQNSSRHTLTIILAFE